MLLSGKTDDVKYIVYWYRYTPAEDTTEPICLHPQALLSLLAPRAEARRKNKGTERRKEGVTKTHYTHFTGEHLSEDILTKHL